MSGELQAFLGRMSLETGALLFTVNDGGGDQQISLTVGEYFPKGYTSETPDQLVEHITTKLQALGGTFVAAACDLSLSTGLVTFSGFGATTSITWDDTTLRDILGFTQGNLSGATSYTADSEMRYVWRPTNSASRLPVNLTRFWEVRSNSMIVDSTDGTPGGRTGKLIYQASINYDQLPLADALIPATGVAYGNRSFESFFIFALHYAARPVRILPDRSSYTASSYHTGSFGRPGQELGALRDWITPTHGEEHHTEWDVNLAFLKYVEV